MTMRHTPPVSPISYLASHAAGINLPIVDHAVVAKKLFDDRRRRDAHFGALMFSEPGWDILLDLRTQFDARRMPGSLSVCAAAPTSTGLRYLRTLECHGWVERWLDPIDCRRRLSRLSVTGAQKMDNYLNELVTNHT